MVNSTYVKHTGEFPENLALPYFLQQDNYKLHNTELLRYEIKIWNPRLIYSIRSQFI